MTITIFYYFIPIFFMILTILGGKFEILAVCFLKCYMYSDYSVADAEKLVNVESIITIL